MKLPKVFLSAGLLLALCAMSACGGGGGDSNTPAPTSNTANAATTQWDDMKWDEGEWQ